MTVKSVPYLLRIPILLLMAMLLCGCGSSSSKESKGSFDSSDQPPVFKPLQVLVPEAPGKDVISFGSLSLDISNISDGYLTAMVSSDGSKSNVQLTGPDNINYSYFLYPEETAVIPFTSGSGEYYIAGYEQVATDQYTALISQVADVELDNEFYPFLYPNQYVNFTPDNEACKMAQEMLPDDADEMEALEAIYDYVIDNITYDDEKAANLELGYLPDIDETLSTGTGICFDYAALMTAMLRARDIPCKLQIGYSGDVKHAWIDVYTRDKGWINKAIAFDGQTWTRMDPTFASGSEDLYDFIGDGTNYNLQFSR